jgi:hypothetical protein
MILTMILTNRAITEPGEVDGGRDTPGGLRAVEG